MRSYKERISPDRANRSFEYATDTQVRNQAAGKLSSTNLHNPITGRESQYIPEIKTMPGRHLSYQGLPRNPPNN